MRARSPLPAAALLAAAVTIASPTHAAHVGTGVIQNATVSKVGAVAAPGKPGRGQIKIAGRFSWDTRELDLRFATVTVEALLEEVGLDATAELVGSDGGIPPLPQALGVKRGARSHSATFRTPGRQRPSFKLDLKRRPRDSGHYQFVLTVNRIDIPTLPQFCQDDGSGHPLTTIETRFMVDDGGVPVLVVPVRGTFRCKSNELKARGGSGSSAVMMGAPTAVLHVETIDRDNGLVRLDASRSEDRDGSILSYEFTVIDRSSGATVVGPELGTTSFLDVLPGPGEFRARVRVTDDAGLFDDAERTFSVRGDSTTTARPEAPRADLRIELMDRESGMVRLDASGSSDKDGVVTSYSFSVIDIATHSMAIGPVAGSESTFDVALPRGDYRGMVEVMDDSGMTAEASRGFSIRSSTTTTGPSGDGSPGDDGTTGGSSREPPSASLRTDLVDRDAGRMLLDASGSFDKDGTIVSWTFWVMDRATGSFAMSPLTASTGMLEVTLPAGEYEAVVEVMDDGGHTDRATRGFTLRGGEGTGDPGDDPTSPQKPTANLAIDTVDRDAGRIRLDASGSVDRDGMIMSWTFWVMDLATGAFAVSPTTVSAGSFELTLPAGEYEGVVEVMDDGGNTSRASRTFTIRGDGGGSEGGGGGAISPSSPTPNLSISKIDRDAGIFRLDASKSFDKDGTIVSYTFSVRDQETDELLLGPTTTTTSVLDVTLPADGEYRGIVVVTDDGGNTSETDRGF